MRLFRDEARLIEAMPQGAAKQVQQRIAAAADTTTLLDRGTTVERRRIVRELISQIVVHQDTLEISVRLSAVWWNEGTEAEDPYVMSVPARLKRCGMAVRLIVPGAMDSRRREPDPRLIGLLAKAQRWFEALKTGRYSSIFEIAQEHRIESKEAVKIVYLAFLAPDIVERIASGGQPTGLGVRRLLAMAPLPLDWAEQRRLFEVG